MSDLLPAKRKKTGKPEPTARFHPSLPNVAQTDMTSEDGRRLKSIRTEHALDSSPLTHGEDTNTMALADQVDGFSYLLGSDVILDEADETAVEESGVRFNVKRKYTSTINPMKVWVPFRDDVLHEILRLEGTAGGDELCSRCADTPRPATHHCCDNDCFALGMVCAECCKEFHLSQPLHFIERWNGIHFEPDTLKALGLTVQLGHSGGMPCPSPTSSTTSFTVLHTNGIHSINLLFCACSTTSDDSYRQLLQSSWWPSTVSQPKTALTFSLLRLAHNLNCTGKLPAWDLWKSLEALTEDRLHTKPPDRYKVLLRVLRQWRHIMMAKTAGRGHDVTGISGTISGGLAVACPACPHPGQNLPDDWQTVATAKSYIYRLFLGLDANFRLRNALVSTRENDPPLADGCAYFVKHAPYMEHIRAFVNEEEMSSCSGFQAMFLANLKNVKGLRTTGVVGVTCSRHSIWRANGIGDLQRGERYCNVDAVVASAVKHDCELLETVFSYDIICQWGVYFLERLKKLPPPFQISFAWAVIFCVPKFHLWAHQAKCHGTYAFNFVPGVGRTHGETIEENWSQSNRAAAQTKVMGPGSRQDTLEDVFSFHNIRTINSFGRVFGIRLAEGIKEARIHRVEYTKFNAGMISYCGQGTVTKWLEDILAWEKDHTKPCPYEVLLQRKDTLKEIQLQLAREEHAAMSQTVGVAPESSLTLFYQTALEIERSQRTLAWEVKARASGTTYQELNIQKQRTSLRRQIHKLRVLQRVLFPYLREFLTPDQLTHLDDTDGIHAEETKLFLPSELKSTDRALPRACSSALVTAEMRLRDGECRDALETLRRGLRTRSAGVLFTVRNVTGQNPTTRAEGIQRKVQVSIKLATLQYKWARNALFRLRGHGDWEQELQILNDDDVRGMNERMLNAEEEEDASRIRESGLIHEQIAGAPTPHAVVWAGETRRRASWIWYSYSDTPSDSGLEDEPVAQEALKIEWSKARARMLRWEEEVELVLEEMRRVLSYRRWKASWWRERNARVSNVSAEIAEGISGYAEASAVREEQSATALEEKWAALRAAGGAFLAGLSPGRIIEFEVEVEDTEVDGAPGDDDDDDENE